MNRKVWLVLDVNNLCYRALHTSGKLSFAGSGTGVIYGVLRAIHSLMDLHATRHVAFCFDHGKNKRKEILAKYKKKRDEKKKKEMEEEDEKKAMYEDLREQVETLKKKHLPRVGFENIFYQEGYEADDMIASVVHNMPKSDEAVIVSSDKDMFQLLSDRVCVWNPVKKECVTRESFVDQWKIDPEEWAHVKALAGCVSDEVPGIRGIGEKTAAAYLRGEHKKGSRVYDLVKEHLDLFTLNLSIVQLPMKGTKFVKLVEDAVKPKAWTYLAEKLGMKSIANRVPGMVNGFGLKPKKLGES